MLYTSYSPKIVQHRPLCRTQQCEDTIWGLKTWHGCVYSERSGATTFLRTRSFEVDTSHPVTVTLVPDASLVLVGKMVKCSHHAIWSMKSFDKPLEHAWSKYMISSMISNIHASLLFVSIASALVQRSSLCCIHGRDQLLYQLKRLSTQDVTFSIQSILVAWPQYWVGHIVFALDCNARFVHQHVSFSIGVTALRKWIYSLASLNWWETDCRFHVKGYKLVDKSSATRVPRNFSV